MIGLICSKPVIPSIQENQLQGNPTLVNSSIKKYVDEFDKTSFETLFDGLNKTIAWQAALYERQKTPFNPLDHENMR
jgi:hypothetical protein